jgi:beta-xylosidase
VKVDNGTKKIVMVSAAGDVIKEVESVPLNQNKIYLKAECNFRDRIDKANFFYSLDGKSWKRIGDTINMPYTLPHFMGYRFGLFNYATKQVGGYVDFDYFHITDKITEE